MYPFGLTGDGRTRLFFQFTIPFQELMARDSFSQITVC